MDEYLLDASTRPCLDLRPDPRHHFRLRSMCSLRHRSMKCLRTDSSISEVSKLPASCTLDASLVKALDLQHEKKNATHFRGIISTPTTPPSVANAALVAIFSLCCACLSLSAVRNLACHPAMCHCVACCCKCSVTGTFCLPCSRHTIPVCCCGLASIATPSTES